MRVKTKKNSQPNEERTPYSKVSWVRAVLASRPGAVGCSGRSNDASFARVLFAAEAYASRVAMAGSEAKESNQEK